MTIARTPSLAHWGAFNALVENGRVIGCEPFARDALPSPMLDAMPEMVHSPLRIARPAIREGWREGRPRSGADRFREVCWDEALDLVAGELTRVRGTYGDTAIFGGSYGWSSAGRVHHARTLVRRFLFLGGGCVDQIGNYSWGAAQFLLPHVIGTYQPVTGRVTDWSSVVKHTRLMIAFGGLRLKNGQVTSGGAGSHVLESWLAPGQRRRHRIRGDQPAAARTRPGFSMPQWLAIRPNTDTALMLALAHTLLVEQRHDAAFLDALLHRLRDVRAAICWARTMARRRMPDGPRRSAASLRTASAISRAARPTRRSLITCAWSLQRAHHGEQPYWATIALAAMLGGIGLPGGGFAFGHGSLNGVGAPRADLPGPEVSTAAQSGAQRHSGRAHRRHAARARAAYEFNGTSRIYPDIRWSIGPAAIRSITTRTSTACAAPGRSRTPSSSTRAGGRRPRAMPISCCRRPPSLERNDVGGSSRDPYVFAMHRAIAPVGEARHDFEIFRDARGRLGYEEAFTEGRDEMGWCQLRL